MAAQGRRICSTSAREGASWDGARAEQPYPAQKKEQFPASVPTGPGLPLGPIGTFSRCSPCCTQPHVLQQASAEPGSQGRTPCWCPAELPVLLQLCQVREAHLSPLAAEALRVLLLLSCCVSSPRQRYGHAGLAEPCCEMGDTELELHWASKPVW